MNLPDIPFDVPTKIVNKYMYGDCGAIAQCLSKMYNFEIYGICDDCNCMARWGSHYVVKLREDKFIDIRGIWSEVNLLDAAYNYRIDSNYDQHFPNSNQKVERKDYCLIKFTDYELETPIFCGNYIEQLQLAFKIIEQYISPHIINFKNARK